MYNQTKIKKFHEYTLEDYNRSLVIDDIVKVSLVEKTDGSFIQIGIRPLIEDDILINPSFHEYLPGAGRMVAVGEMEFLIKNLIENKDIEVINFNEDIKEFPKHVFDFNNAIILLSTKFYVEVFTKLMHRIDYGERYPKLDYRYSIISIPEKVLGNKIIIIDKNAILWEKQLFDNKETGKKEAIDINIKPAEEFGKVDITIRSVNKIRYVDPELIKILEVKNEQDR